MAVRKVAWGLVLLAIVIIYVARRTFFAFLVRGAGLVETLFALVVLIGAFAMFLQFLKLTDAPTGDRPWVPSEDEMDEWNDDR